MTALTPEAVGASLTAAQRRALARHKPTYGSAQSGWPQSAHDPESYNHAGRALMEAKLIAWTTDPKSSATCLTPLGLDVRAALLSKDPAP